MERVVVLGPGGAGKSTLARSLARSLRIPLHELDAAFWNERLDPMPRDEWHAYQTLIAAEPAWVLDGDLGPYDDLEPRLRQADTVVVLDVSPWLCALRVLRRGRERRDFWKWMLCWRRESRDQLLGAVASFAPRADVAVLHSRVEIDGWLTAVLRQ
jgi:adenylate kinase family enzyme